MYFVHLSHLDTAAGKWVSCLKSKKQYPVNQEAQNEIDHECHWHELSELTGNNNSASYGRPLRLVKAYVRDPGCPSAHDHSQEQPRMECLDCCQIVKGHVGSNSFFKELELAVELVGFSGYNEERRQVARMVSLSDSLPHAISGAPEQRD